MTRAIPYITPLISYLMLFLIAVMLAYSLYKYPLYTTYFFKEGKVYKPFSYKSVGQIAWALAISISFWSAFAIS